MNLKLIHIDMANFKNTMSWGEKRHYVAFSGDHSRFNRVYLLRTKDQVEEMFEKYKAKVENQLDGNINTLRSGRLGEDNVNTLKKIL